MDRYSVFAYLLIVERNADAAPKKGDNFFHATTDVAERSGESGRKVNFCGSRKLTAPSSVMAQAVPSETRFATLLMRLYVAMMSRCSIFAAEPSCQFLLDIGAVRHDERLMQEILSGNERLFFERMALRHQDAPALLHLHADIVVLPDVHRFQKEREIQKAAVKAARGDDRRCSCIY